MNLRIVYLLLISAILPFVVSCSIEDDASDVVVYVKNQVPDSVNVGQFVELDIFALTPNEYVKEIRISTFDADNGEVLSDVITPGEHKKEFNDLYVFQVPQVLSENTEIKIYIDAYDNFDNKTRFTFKMYVFGANLKELSGLLFFNPMSDKNDGFDILLKKTIRKDTHLANDSTAFWLRQFTDEEKLGFPEYLPLELNTSVTGSRITFALSNSFNYGEATTISLESAYLAMSANNYVSHLNEGDIILIGVDNKGWGVMQVLDIDDAPGIVDDKMIVNIKYIN